MRARSIRFVRSKKKFIETCVDLRRFWRAPNENARKRIERYTHDRLKNVLTPNVAVLNGQKRFQCKRVVFREVVPKPCCRSIHGNMLYKYSTDAKNSHLSICFFFVFREYVNKRKHIVFHDVIRLTRGSKNMLSIDTEKDQMKICEAVMLHRWKMSSIHFSLFIFANGFTKNINMFITA